MTRSLKTALFTSLAVFLILAFDSGSVYARKLVVVTVNHLTLQDISQNATPNLYKIIESGAVSLLSPNCSGPKTETSVLLTAASGNPSAADIWLKNIRCADELIFPPTTAGMEFKLRTGLTPKPQSGVFLDIAKAESLNHAPKGGFKTGLLGDSLKAAGKTIYALGNADVESDVTPLQCDRSSAIIGCDSQGIIDRFDPFPSGVPKGRSNWLTDPDKLAESVSKALNESDAVVACFGDLVRLDELKLNMTDRSHSIWRLRALRRLDMLAGRLIECCNKQNAALVIVSFGLPELKTWDQLPPVLIWGYGSGMLTSASSRTSGLITAADFAPTMLKILEINPIRRVVGRHAYTSNVPVEMGKLEELNARVNVNRKLLDPMGGVCAGLAAIAFCSFAIVTAFGLKVNIKSRYMMRFGMLAVISLPSGMLLASAFPPGVLWYIGATVVISLSAAAIALRVADKYASCRGCAPAIIYAWTVLLIIADAFAGSPLCRYAMPSSYQLAGMRYFGTGNEYAAFAIAMAGCAILSFGAMFPQKKMFIQRIAAITGAVLSVSLGWGIFGANYGATAAAITTFALIWLSFFRERFHLRHIILAVLGGMFTSFVLSEIDAFIMGEMSAHAGRAVNTANSEGFGYLLDILLRKIGFNLKTVFGAIAGMIILAFSPFLYFWFSKIHAKVNRILDPIPAVRSGYLAMVAGSGAAFLLNDSGIVMAAIMLGIVLSTLLYSLFEMETTGCLE